MYTPKVTTEEIIFALAQDGKFHLNVYADWKYFFTFFSSKKQNKIENKNEIELFLNFISTLQHFIIFDLPGDSRESRWMRSRRFKDSWKMF